MLYEWKRAFDVAGVTSRRAYVLFLLEWVIVLLCVFALFEVSWRFFYPSVRLFVEGILLAGLLCLSGCVFFSASIRRIRDTGVSLLLPATAFIMVCFAVSFDLMEILLLDWYDTRFWTGDGLSWGLSKFMQFLFLTCLSASFGALALSGRAQN